MRRWLRNRRRQQLIANIVNGILLAAAVHDAVRSATRNVRSRKPAGNGPLETSTGKVPPPEAGLPLIGEGEARRRERELRRAARRRRMAHQ